MKRIVPLLLLAASCSDSGPGGPTACTTATDCADGESCFMGMCTPAEELPDIVLEEVDPIRSPARGGDTVTLRGAGFTADMTVTIGEVEAEVASVSLDFHLTQDANADAAAAPSLARRWSQTMSS